MIDSMKSRIETVLGDIDHLRQFVPHYDAMATTIACLHWCQSLPFKSAGKFTVVSGDRALAKFSRSDLMFELVSDPREALLLDREAAYSIQFQLDGHDHRKWLVQKFGEFVDSVAERQIEELMLAAEFALTFQKVLQVRATIDKATAFRDVEFKVASLLAMMRETSSEQFVVQIDGRFVRVDAPLGSTIVEAGYGDLTQACLFSKDGAYGIKFLLEAEGEGGVEVVGARSASIASCRNWIESIGTFLNTDVH